MLIEFAPLNVPFERRCQTAAVLFFSFFFLFAPPLSVIFTIYLLYTSYWWIIALYFVWFIYDYRTPERGSRPSSWLRGWKVWKYYANYFPIKLVKTADLSPEHNYIIG
ncbi:hypothetical protein AB6A40_011369 [Gnathostoma spinigerum]|uniref:diacylglycerol O-acyltransferase n=1 Tax=Gnathostoma spinigerum TaxID=75299 RepID=A0ABD6F4L0_9BILA